MAVVAEVCGGSLLHGDLGSAVGTGVEKRLAVRLYFFGMIQRECLKVLPAKGGLTIFTCKILALGIKDHGSPAVGAFVCKC